jgi:ATP-dependent DNA helicase RecG
MCERGLLVSDGRRRWTHYRLPWMASDGAKGVTAPQVNSSLKGGSSSLKDDIKDEGSAKAPLAETEAGAWRELVARAAAVAGIKRATAAQVREVIRELCHDRFLTLGELATLLNRRPVPLRNNYLTYATIT